MPSGRLACNFIKAVLEPVVFGSFTKKVFANNSQNSQENTCVGVFLNKVPDVSRCSSK